MSRQRKIINTNIRLNLMDPEDQQAWAYLQSLDRKEYKSYSRAVVAAVNDYFGRQEQHGADPYLETRMKEDAFLERVLEAIEQGAKQAVPLVMAGQLLQLLQPALAQCAAPMPAPEAESNNSAVPSSDVQEASELDEIALDFVNGF